MYRSPATLAFLLSEVRNSPWQRYGRPWVKVSAVTIKLMHYHATPSLRRERSLLEPVRDESSHAERIGRQVTLPFDDRGAG